MKDGGPECKGNGRQNENGGNWQGGNDRKKGREEIGRGWREEREKLCNLGKKRRVKGRRTVSIRNKTMSEELN